MSYPVGHFNCKLDSKGRLSFPSEFKEQFGDQVNEGFVLHPAPYVKCLELYTKKDIANYLPVLGGFLYRERNPHLKSLEIMLLTFIEKVRQLGIVDCGDRIVEYGGHKYDTKTEDMIE